MKIIEFTPKNQDSLSSAIELLASIPLANGVLEYHVHLQDLTQVSAQTQVFINELTDVEGEFVMDDETILFLSAIEHKELIDSIERFVKKTIEFNQSVGRHKIPYTDPERPFAFSASHALALYDKKFIILFIRYLQTLNLDFEVYTFGAIESIFRKFGICDETLELASARILSCAGQHGLEQIVPLFKEKKETDEYQKLLLKLKVNDSDFPLKEDFLTYFFEEMNS
ncbi:hypothetical protein EHQ92_05670 [Leptospira biflexa]|jgi:hypothetical protein|uniref:Uncharacterized protein n=1 Tax=Leptospira biflexa serovar Patoc (strain Patoc 1 / ATCC 23582 / Paris) TaxID=456481 RepID=B0SIW6_LEPBP|nr:hypothetical protein [Leptospira biflexa]ABZ92948.1 Hypothetical protein LBF_0402 [Leptospira biflexa serovar Patoc strain 'Patoc 1 (Ames)']ABZ96559.1 Hypothetical protein LEPBI_I0417 [Leptospira biflexa serovar Patoc strain 'Patoc 1 (Paris)']TGM37872.1 hypothetical protein EHQ80_09855 [Leptospira biflexa]TGM41203.1 hypothetical protein EHQ89_04420 [Leptospira biflexa]TGM47406.1 hypothetical protein EHQ92_05670 [Leptospira biflexa]